MTRSGAPLDWLHRLRRTRWANLVVINLRILIGFAFLPAALKKVMAQPFTDPANTGIFHEFLHAFHATGPFYQFVGVMQLLAALLLSTQYLALAGAFVALPILTAICVFVWSTIGLTPTAVVASLMLLGVLGLIVWDVDRWGAVFGRSRAAETLSPVSLRPWMWCGAAIWALYIGLCIAHGGVYRPRGVALDDPAFYVLPVIALLPVVTGFISRRR
jgi:hypothetical protein